MEDRLTPVLYLEMTEADPDDYAARPRRRRARTPRRRAGHVVAERLPRPARPPARAGGVRHPRGLRVRPVVRRPAHARRHRRPPLPAHAAAGSGPAHGQAHGVALAGVDQPDHRGRGAGVARLGRLRAPQLHRRGGHTRLRDDHSVRERHQGRPALPALLRVRRSRRRGHVQADAPARGDRRSERGERPSARRGRSIPRCASCTSTRSSSSATRRASRPPPTRWRGRPMPAARSVRV